MRIAIVYDCLYPHTVGGAERWYRDARGAAARAGTRSPISRGASGRREDPGPRSRRRGQPAAPLYTASGRRRIWPPLRFGLGVFWHLLRHGGRYDVVHSARSRTSRCSAPGSRCGCAGERRLVVDWFEVWSRDYWIEYLGPVGGRIGHAVQRLCVAAPRSQLRLLAPARAAAAATAEGHRAPLTGV